MEADKESVCSVKVKATRCNRQSRYPIQHSAAFAGTGEIQGAPPEGDDSVAALLAEQRSTFTWMLMSRLFWLHSAFDASGISEMDFVNQTLSRWFSTVASAIRLSVWLPGGPLCADVCTFSKCLCRFSRDLPTASFAEEPEKRMEICRRRRSFEHVFGAVECER